MPAFPIPFTENGYIKEKTLSLLKSIYQNTKLSLQHVVEIYVSSDILSDSNFAPAETEKC